MFDDRIFPFPSFFLFLHSIYILLYIIGIYAFSLLLLFLFLFFDNVLLKYKRGIGIKISEIQFYI